MGTPTSKRERVFTGIAVVVILALALWLFLGRSPGGPKRVEVAFGERVETDVGTVTVFSLDEVPAGTKGAPAATDGDEVRAIRFRSCRNDRASRLVDLDLFSVTFSGLPAAPAAGSKLTDSAGSCVGGLVYVQAPLGVSPSAVEYAADPTGVWAFQEG